MAICKGEEEQERAKGKSMIITQEYQRGRKNI